MTLAYPWKLIAASTLAGGNPRMLPLGAWFPSLNAAATTLAGIVGSGINTGPELFTTPSRNVQLWTTTSDNYLGMGVAYDQATIFGLLNALYAGGVPMYGPVVGAAQQCIAPYEIKAVFSLLVLEGETPPGYPYVGRDTEATTAFVANYRAAQPSNEAVYFLQRLPYA